MDTHLCPACRPSLSRSSPDFLALSSVADLRLRTLKQWREGAERNCSFCSLIVAVYEDSQQRHGCCLWDGDGLDSTPLHVVVVSTNGHFVPVIDIRIPNGNDSEEDNDLGFYTNPGSLTIYSHDTSGSIYSSMAPYAAVQSRAGALGCYDVAKNWLSCCQSGHSECSAREPSFVPHRLLDITPTLSEPKLLIDPPAGIEYVALSHCWGSAQPLKTEQWNLEEHVQGIPYRTLPRTFQDAITVSRELGYQFIWIDTLCIIQDDAQDWEIESSVMASVYGSADLVLAATSAVSTEDGFLDWQRPPYAESTVNLAVKGCEDGKVTYRLVHHPRWQLEGPLERRAWAFQEKMVARRYLAYDTQQLRWECRASTLSESGWVDAFPFWSDGHTRPLGSVLSKIPYEKLTVYWRKRIVNNYTSRELSHESDKLVALSAVASRFQERYQGTYLAGLWKEDIVNELRWSVSGGSLGAGQPRDFGAPSWSWASVKDRPISYDSDDNEGEISTVIECAELVEVDTHTSTSGLFSLAGGGGLIRLRGKMTRATYTRKFPPDAEEEEWSDMNTRRIKGPGCDWGRASVDTPIERFRFTAQDGSTRTSIRRVLLDQAGPRGREKRTTPVTTEGDDGDSDAVFSIWLFSLATSTSVSVSGDLPKDRTYRDALILGEVDDKDGRYQRLGFWEGVLLNGWTDNWEMREVVIV